MPVPVALQALAYILTAAAAVDSLTTKPPENKLTTTGDPSGGNTAGQAAAIFSQGQPGATPQLPTPVAPQANPQAESLIGSIIAGGQKAPVVSAETYGNPMQAGVPPLMPKDIPPPTEANIPPSMDEFFASLGGAASALSKAAPLLGLTDEPRSRSIATAGAAGGQPGQAIFGMPQRQTLAQILASLPRTM